MYYNEDWLQRTKLSTWMSGLYIPFLDGPYISPSPWIIYWTMTVHWVVHTCRSGHGPYHMTCTYIIASFLQSPCIFQWSFCWSLHVSHESHFVALSVTGSSSIEEKISSSSSDCLFCLSAADSLGRNIFCIISFFRAVTLISQAELDTSLSPDPGLELTWWH